MNAQRLVRLLTRPEVLRPLFAVLRRFAPLLALGKRTIVARYLDVVEVLERDTDFTVSELNGPNIERHDGPFVLGLDRGPQYDRESDLLHAVVRPEDLDRIAGMVAREAAQQIEGAWPVRRIDVVNGYARLVAMRVAAAYFGVPEDRERKMAGWLRDIFWDIFLNVTGDGTVRARAQQSGAALRAHLNGAIATREAAGPAGLRDDVLGRLLALKGPLRPWLDNRTIRRNLTGAIAGTVENTSHFFAAALAQLLRRPEALAGARAAALAGDGESVRRYLYEAARFDPAAPLLARYVPRDTVLAAGTPRARRLPAGTTLIVGTISALFDPDGFDDPNSFDIDHAAGSLHFGLGLHRCLGYRINGVQLAELGKALLVLSDLRFAPKGAGRMNYEGPFPNRLLVDFA